jgi:hypothetical protein
MFSDWQLAPTPASVPEAAGERSQVLVQLLEEVERNEEAEQEAARRPAPERRSRPQPFAYD